MHTARSIFETHAQVSNSRRHRGPFELYQESFLGIDAGGKSHGPSLSHTHTLYTLSLHSLTALCTLYTLSLHSLTALCTLNTPSLHSLTALCTLYNPSLHNPTALCSLYTLEGKLRHIAVIVVLRVTSRIVNIIYTQPLCGLSDPQIAFTECFHI